MANAVHVGAQTNHAAAVAKVKGDAKADRAAAIKGANAPKPAKGGKGKGGGGRGGGVDPLQAMAQQQVSLAEAPIEQQIAAEKQSNLAAAQRQMGFAKAAAAIMQQAAPAIGNAYSGAANADAGYSRGLGSGVQAQLDQNQQNSNNFLTQMGTPASALHQAAPVGDMAYGLQGYIPATTLQREGAGWESAAQLAPGNTLHAGQQLAQETLANDPALAKLQDELGKIAGTEPSLYDKLVSLSQGQQRVSQGNVRLQQGQQRLGLTAQRNAVLANQGQQRINLEGARLQVSIRQAAQRNAQAWARIGISQKSLRLRAAAAQAKVNTGGFTPDELLHIKNTAANMASALHDGVAATSTKAALPPKSYQQAMNYMVSHGIPPSIAMSELKTAGYNPPPQPTGVGMGFLDNIGRSLGSLNGPLGGAVTGAVASRIVGLAHEFLGTPYVWGGSTPKGFDCSGFLQYLYSKVGISIPRTTYTQWTAGRAVSQANLRPGDAVFFKGSDSRGGLPGHVGVYIGDGMMIDAPHTGSSVRIESIYGFGGYMGARRFGKG